jgi:hypothetical protein
MRKYSRREETGRAPLVVRGNDRRWSVDDPRPSPRSRPQHGHPRLDTVKRRANVDPRDGDITRTKLARFSRHH